MSALVPLKIPFGFFRNGTEYETKGRIYDGNLVRWQRGRLRPWGGWQRATDTGLPLDGIARATVSWRANNGFRYRAIGTNTKLYVNGGGRFTDVTPVDLEPGRADAIAGAGFGAGSFGRGKYGTQRTSIGLVLDAATWSFDLWGENLEMVFSPDGKLREYSPSTGTISVVANAPTGNGAVLVTDEQYVVLLGAGGNKRRVAWCDQNNNTVWAAADTNTAGGFSLPTQGNIVTGKKIGSVPLIFTGNDVHILNYLGAPDVYGTRKLADNCGIISPNALATDENTGYWMGLNGFFAFDGLVRPLPCDVQDYVFDNLNRAQRSKIFVGRNSKDGELIWFYPSASATEIDSYVVYNYFYKIWYFGRLARTCWEDRGVYVNPVGVDPAGIVYEHEVGFLADGASRNSDVYVQTGPIELDNGDQILYANLMLPDMDSGTADAVQVRFKMKTAPNGRETSYGPYSFVPNAEGYVPVRIAGRQAVVRIEQISDKDWSVGTPRFVVSAGGRR